MELVGQGDEGSAMQMKSLNGDCRFKMRTHEWVPATVFTMRLCFQRQAGGKTKRTLDIISNIRQKLRMEI